MRRAPAILLVPLAACAFAACGKNGPVGRDHTATQTTARTSTTARTQTSTTKRPIATPRHTADGCAPVAAAQPRPGSHLRRPRRTLSRSRRFVATMRTNCGTIRISLDVKQFPKTAGSFIRLSRTGFYDGLSFHRIAKPGGSDFVIQGGDPLGTGEGGPGYSIVERPPKNQRYSFGTVAMAKAGNQRPGTSGSQFFIVTGDGNGLDPLYAVIGQVTGGSGVVRRIAAVPADPETEMPIDPVIIRQVAVRELKR